MPNPAILAPVAGDDPCGPDLRWDPDFQELSQAMELAGGAGDSVLDAELTTSDAPSLAEVITGAEALCVRTKDLRVLAMHAEASWRHQGLAAFVDSLEDLVAVAVAWPDGAEGVHPRADPDDGDLGERSAPVGKLLNAVPVLANTVGWGTSPPPFSAQQVAGARLKSVFDAWSDALEPALGPDLSPARDAWRSLSPLIATADTGAEDPEAADGDTAGAAVPPPADAWDMIARAADLMVQQDHHSPSIPVLRMLTLWRSREITEIADLMRPAGVSLEQLLESIKQQHAAASQPQG